MSSSATSRPVLKGNQAAKNKEPAETKGIIPELLRKRLESRKNARVYLICSFTINFLMAILSGFYCHFRNDTSIFHCMSYFVRYIVVCVSGLENLPFIQYKEG